jgi:hypothetical protein
MYFARTKDLLYNINIVLLVGFCIKYYRGIQIEIWQLFLFIEQLYDHDTLSFLNRVSRVTVTLSDVIVCYNYRECNSFCDLLK